MSDSGFEIMLKHQPVKVGEFMGLPIYVDPMAPPNQVSVMPDSIVGATRSHIFEMLKSDEFVKQIAVIKNLNPAD